MSAAERARSVFALLLTAAVLSAALCFASCSAAGGSEKPEYITDRAGLMKALAGQSKVIHLDDISFDPDDVPVEIGRSIALVGRPDCSVLKNVRISVTGPEVESEAIAVSFENLVFDGCFVPPEGDPGSAGSFREFYGDRTGKGCVVASGFVDLGFTGCTVRGYCSGYGAAMYLHYTDGNDDLGTRASLTVRNCLFTGNICEKGVLWCNGKNTRLEMTDCVFDGNTVNSGAVVLGGVNGSVERLTVRGGRRIVFTEKNSFPAHGGGLLLSNSAAVIRDSVFEGCRAESGGGVTVSGSHALFDSCSFTGNIADTYGGAMRLESSETCPVYITNCGFKGNSAQLEAAVFVLPADQIGIGLPTGVTEFSFCSFSGNTAREPGESLVFHPVRFESGADTAGRDGMIDFFACRITDENVSMLPGQDENFNLINVNTGEKGGPVPESIVSAVADGLYAGTGTKMYPGINGARGDGGRAWLAAAVISAAVCAGGAAVFIILFRRSRKKARVPAEALPHCPSGSSGEPAAAEKVFADLRCECSLTDREIDVLREYLSEKTRIEIAETLYISESTVKNHISKIFSKLGVRNKRELLSLLRSRGMTV